MIAYKFKLYSNASRSKVLPDLMGQFRRLYNYCIGTHQRYYKWYGKYLSCYDLQKHITKLKKRPYYDWIKKLDAQAVQDVTERIDKGFRLFFSNKKKHIKASAPTFKSQHKYNSFTLKQTGYKLLEGNRIRVFGHIYKYHKSHEIEGKVKTVTIKRDNLGSLWLVIIADYERTESVSSTGFAVGFDFGMKTFLVGSDGTTIDFPLYLKQSMSKVKKLSRNLSHKKKGSNNRQKAKLQLARLYRKVQNQREDYQWKLARKLVLSYDLICLEDLNLKGMSKHFGKQIGDFGLYSFEQKLIYLSRIYGKRIKYINRFFPSSKTCSNCGYVNHELKLSDRSWVCPNCGKHHDRDFNASVNILREGASSLGVGEVRPSLEGIRC